MFFPASSGAVVTSSPNLENHPTPGMNFFVASVIFSAIHILFCVFILFSSIGLPASKLSVLLALSLPPICSAVLLSSSLLALGFFCLRKSIIFCSSACCTQGIALEGTTTPAPLCAQAIPHNHPDLCGFATCHLDCKPCTHDCTPTGGRATGGCTVGCGVI